MLGGNVGFDGNYLECGVYVEIYLTINWKKLGVQSLIYGDMEPSQKIQSWADFGDVTDMQEIHHMENA
jgi:hypothetical protein